MRRVLPLRLPALTYCRSTPGSAVITASTIRQAAFSTSYTSLLISLRNQCGRHSRVKTMEGKSSNMSYATRLRKRTLRRTATGNNWKVCTWYTSACSFSAGRSTIGLLNNLPSAPVKHAQCRLVNRPSELSFGLGEIRVTVQPKPTSAWHWRLTIRDVRIGIVDSTQTLTPSRGEAAWSFTSTSAIAAAAIYLTPTLAWYRR